MDLTVIKNPKKNKKQNSQLIILGWETFLQGGCNGKFYINFALGIDSCGIVMYNNQKQ